MYKDEVMIRRLLDQMTLEEKAAQLTGMIPTSLIARDGIRTDVAQAFLGDGIGYIEPFIGGFPRDAAGLARVNNLIQRHLVENTRLGIPAIMHVEALNGINGPSFTCFPTAIGLAATWDPSGVGEMADLTRRQMRATGLHQALSPLLDVARDARWGRVHESYGEDPYLISALGVEFVRRLQAGSPHERVLATGKHFVGYGMPEAGLNMASSVITRRDLVEVYARPFAAAIQMAGLCSVMTSLSDWDGVPAAADPRVFRELLRERLGFDGVVVSDWSAVENLVTHHRAAADAQEAGVLALTAGVDVELPRPFGYGRRLVSAVRDGKVAAALVDEAVLRVLRHKAELGLFANPYVPEEPAEILSVARDGEDLSRRLACESVTLLKNDEAVLPLRAEAPKIAVVGPHASLVDAAFPPYTYPSFVDLTRAVIGGIESSMVGADSHEAVNETDEYVLESMAPVLGMSRERFARDEYGAVSLAEAIASAMPAAEVRVVEGCGMVEGDVGIGEAVAAASDADVVVLALGDVARWFFAERSEGEGADLADVSLPEPQRRLVAAVREAGTPTVGVVFAGRPFALGDVEEHLDAILYAYFGAQHGTRAVADVITGRVEPQGRLPFTVPRRSGQVPIHSGQRFGSGYRRPLGDPMGGYVDVDGSPLYAFGHGLSYTSVEYEELRIDHAAVAPDGAVLVEAVIRNAGARRAVETVQLYVEDTAVGIARPARQLCGFERVVLEPGQSARVSFKLRMPILAYLDSADRWIVEPGQVKVLVGPSSEDLPLFTEIALVGDVADVSDDRVYLTESSAVLA